MNTALLIIIVLCRQENEYIELYTTVRSIIGTVHTGKGRKLELTVAVEDEAQLAEEAEARLGRFRCSRRR